MPNKSNDNKLKTNAVWSDKPSTPEDIRRRMEEAYNKLPVDQRNPHAKEAFDDLMQRAVSPVPVDQEKSADRASYSGKQTR